MSADDAQQNIPSGHVAKMRQAVDELNRAKRVKTAIGIAIMPVSRTETETQTRLVRRGQHLIGCGVFPG